MIDYFACSYDNLLIMVDFKMEPSDPSLTSFCNSNSLIVLIKNNTCFNSIGSCIDIILNSGKYSFKNTRPPETGHSDHHHMIYKILKSSNEEPKFLNFRVYENFPYENFKGDLSNAFGSSSNLFDEFDHIFMAKSDKHAPKKKELIRENSKPPINRKLRLVIMKSSRLKNTANKTKHPNDIKNYKRQRNYVLNLNKNAKFVYCNRYNSKNSKLLWVSCKAYFSKKHSKADTGIMLTENGKSVLKNNEIVNAFREYFRTIVEDLDLYYWKDNSELLSNTKSFGRINNIIRKQKSSKHKKHQKQFQNAGNFSFGIDSLDEAKKVI